MNNNLLQIKIKQRLNKLASFDYDNLECWMVMEAVNKAQLEWARRQLHGLNLKKEGPEQSINTVDDLQVLLKQQELSGTHTPKYFESEFINEDYLHFVRISADAKTDCCPERSLSIYQVEEANVDVLLFDDYKNPSFEWAETFCTVFANKVRIYTDDKFDVVNALLTYYRKPREILFIGCTNPSTGTIVPADVTCEFKDDICEIIIDEAAAILAGDIESITQYQREIQNAQRNS